jgi:hypothetical protein
LISLAAGPAAGMVAEVQGRRQEILRFPTTAGEAAVHPMVFRRVMRERPKREWQIIPARDGLTMLLRGVGHGVADEPVVRELRRVLAAHDVVVPTITVRGISAIPRGLGKD